jgi:hypothetical protein
MHLFGVLELEIRPGTPDNPAGVKIALLRYTRGEDSRLFITPECTAHEEIEGQINAPQGWAGRDLRESPPSLSGRLSAETRGKITHWSGGVTPSGKSLKQLRNVHSFKDLVGEDNNEGRDFRLYPQGILARTNAFGSPEAQTNRRSERQRRSVPVCIEAQSFEAPEKRLRSSAQKDGIWAG